MHITRRTLWGSGATLAAATALPNVEVAAQQPERYVRKPLSALSPQELEYFRRGVHVMMGWSNSNNQQDYMRSWEFQANIHGVASGDPWARYPQFADAYWNQCPHGNYFFLSWHRMYLSYFERILRVASGNPLFALPYWDYDQPGQDHLPVPFRPAINELMTPAPDRTNPLARAVRDPRVDDGTADVRDVAAAIRNAMALTVFSTDDPVNAPLTFGGVSTSEPNPHLADLARGAIETSPHNMVHMALGGVYEGRVTADMGDTTTAARDPIFWCHHAAIDRLWVNWTKQGAGRGPPVNDVNWSTRRFTFVDENGGTVQPSGADILDTQFDLGYRYWDDPLRSTKLPSPGGSPAPLGTPVRLGAVAFGKKLSENAELAYLDLTDARQFLGNIDRERFLVVFRDIAFMSRTAPYDVYLGFVNVQPLKVGTLALFGGGHGGIVSLDASAAFRQLARQTPTLSLVVEIIRWQYQSGNQRIPMFDPDPPEIGTVEFWKV